MGVVTAATSPNVQGIIKCFNIAAIGDGDTFEGPSNPKAFWVQLTADPTTNTSAGCNVAHSGTTYTFYPGIVALSGTLFVVV